MNNLAELEINLENLSQNLRNLKGLLKSETKFLAVVKSNAYGHGIIQVSKSAIEAGADWLGVVNINEAIQLREANIHKPILILGEILNDDLRTAANKDISVPIISVDKARVVADINFDKPLKVHLKIDTGLNRLGIENNEIAEVVRILSSHRNIIIEGVYSHLASVEENDLTYTKFQIKNFKEAIKILKQNGIDNVIKHIAASAATMIIKDSHFDMVRCGIAIYGLWPSKEVKEKYCSSSSENFIKPVLTYKTQIVQIKQVIKGEKIGYGCSFIADSNMTIAIIPVGYADGIDRGLSGEGEVLISQTRCLIVGRVAMNMIIIDISNLKPETLKPGLEVTIIGKDGSEEITVDEIAKKLGTINYEIVARLPAHLPRIYRD